MRVQSQYIAMRVCGWRGGSWVVSICCQSPNHHQQGGNTKLSHKIVSHSSKQSYMPPKMQFGWVKLCLHSIGNQKMPLAQQTGTLGHSYPVCPLPPQGAAGLPEPSPSQDPKMANFGPKNDPGCFGKVCGAYLGSFGPVLTRLVPLTRSGP